MRTRALPLIAVVIYNIFMQSGGPCFQDLACIHGANLLRVRARAWLILNTEVFTFKITRLRLLLLTLFGILGKGRAHIIVPLNGLSKQAGPFVS